MTNTTDGLKVGDYFYSLWGYDETHVTFFRVVSLTAQSARVQEVEASRVGSDGYQDLMVPTANPRKRRNWEKGGNGEMTDAPIRTKRIRNGFKDYSFNVNSYSDAYLWKGGRAAVTNPAFGR